MNIHVTPQPLGQPAPGAARPGNLYADLQSRSLWLGVDPAVDPSGSVLISDMLSLMDDIADAEANARAYTDSQVATRAPLVHTHTAAQITDFTGAVTTVVAGLPGMAFTRGMVVMWSGLVTQIGVGDLAGWALCDGGNGTPNLTDKFILGAGGGVSPLATNPLASFLTNVQGSHNHTINGYTLTLADIPKHNHGVGTLDVTLGGTLTTGTGSANHAHTIPGHGGGSGSGAKVSAAGDAGAKIGDFPTNSTGLSHSHTATLPGSVTTTVTGATALTTSGDGSHAHTMVDNGSHQHTITSQQVRDTAPWLALAYIMKL